MDKVYLKALEASPHIDEGLFDRIKARGAAGIQRYKGITGGGWKPLDEAKLESLWNSFKKKLHGLIQDFKVNVLPNIQKNRPQDVSHYQGEINKFESLAKTLHVAPELTDKQLHGALREAGIGKFFRPLGITKALMSNDTNQTIEAYKAQIRKLYNEFVADVQKVTKIPPDYIGRNIVKNKPEWAKIFNQTQAVLGLPISKPVQKAEPSAAPPSAEAPTEAPPEAAQSPGEAPEPEQGSPQDTGGEQPAKAAPTPPATGKEPSASGNADMVSGNIDVEVLLKTIALVIDRVRSDDKRSKVYMSTPIDKWKEETATKVPGVTWEPQGKLQEADETGDEGGDQKEEPIDPSDPEGKKGFLYRFRQEYRKHTGSFTYRLGVFEHKGKIYEVLWHSYGAEEKGHGHINDIRVKIYDKAKKEKPVAVRLFHFFDHQIDPREPAAADFSIPKLFMKANPNLPNPFNKQDMQRLAPYQEMFHRALFAVTDRKSMEYKVALPPKAKEAHKRLLALGWDESEAEDFIGKAIKKIGTNADPEALVDTAIAIKAEEEQSGAYVGKPQNQKDAEAALVKLGKKPDLAKELVAKAVASLGPNASVENLVHAAVKYGKAGPPKTATPAPAAAAAQPPQPTQKQPVPVVHNDGRVEWMGKTYKYPQALPKALYAALDASGQREKYNAVVAPLIQKTKEKKAAAAAKASDTSKKTKFVKELINPFNAANFVQ